MIYYFSGTGNSQWIAEQLAAYTHDQAQNIVPLIKDASHGTIAIPADGTVGLVFPIYAWGAPKIIDEFVKRLVIPSSAYVFAVCSCGDDTGRALEKLRKRFPWKAGWSLSMPNNYIVLYDVDPPELVKAKIAHARESIAAIAADIGRRAALTSIRHGSFALLKTALVNPLFKAFASSTAPFLADDTCTGCGLCSDQCPRGAIRMENGRPVWIKKHCLQCLCCMHRCPQGAIQYGEATRTRGRYFFSE